MNIREGGVPMYGAGGDHSQKEDKGVNKANAFDNFAAKAQQRVKPETQASYRYGSVCYE